MQMALMSTKRKADLERTGGKFPCGETNYTLANTLSIRTKYPEARGIHQMERPTRIKPATGRHCVLALGDPGTVPPITSDCSRVAELFMRRRYVDLCVTTSSRTMLTFENNVSCSSRDCSTIAFCRR